MQVDFIGLGNMGEPMARNLLKAGHQLSVHNRTRAKAEALGSEGARIAAIPRDTLPADVLITMLADDKAVESMMFGPGGLAADLPPGAIHLSMSTIGVALSQRLAKAHAEKGQIYVSAPVFGRPDAAAAARLNIVAAGPGAAIARCQPLLDAIGQRTFVIGEQPELANVMKLAGNFLIGAAIESMGEAVALVRKSGGDPHKFIEVITSTIFGAIVYKGYGGAIADQRYQPPGFALPLGLKDIKLALAAADAVGAPMPVASLVRDQAMSAMARGYAELDWAALGKLAAENAGLDGADAKQR